MKRLIHLVLLAAAFLCAGNRVANKTAGGGAFTYPSAVFDGSQSITRAGTLTGATGNYAKVTLSVWVKPSTNFDIVNFVYEQGGYITIWRTGSNLIQVDAYTQAGVKVVDLNSGISQVDSGTWYHVLVGWDLGTSGARYIYIDGVDCTTPVTFTTSNTVYFGNDPWGFCNNSSGTQAAEAKISELWFSNDYIDLSNSANRAKFRTAGGHPANLGADGTAVGMTPLVYFHTPPNNWHTNLGTGGTMTLGGTITDGGADIP